jgi:hypothetical protein
MTSQVLDDEGRQEAAGKRPADVVTPAGATVRWSWLEWFWRGEALRQARLPSRSQAASSARERAAIALEVGEAVLNPGSRWRAGNAYHLAAGLFVDSIAWSLRLASTKSSPETSPPLSTRPELEALLSTHQPVLAKAARSAEVLMRVTRHILERDFDGALSSSEAERCARELGLVAARLLDDVDVAEAELETLRFQRAVRSAGLVLLVGFVAVLLRVAHGQWQLRSDISLGKPWKVSSSQETICPSPQRDCGQTQRYFFHTREDESPWLELDLGQDRRVSRIQVTNRSDCCGERAVPLVVEVSTDHETYREVIRRDTNFREWQASFAPTNARWVRFRVARRSLLHLNSVRVFE